VNAAMLGACAVILLGTSMVTGLWKPLGLRATPSAP
jgi:hypothetical protein